MEGVLKYRKRTRSIGTNRRYHNQKSFSLLLQSKTFPVWFDFLGQYIAWTRCKFPRIHYINCYMPCPSFHAWIMTTSHLNFYVLFISLSQIYGRNKKFRPRISTVMKSGFFFLCFSSTCNGKKCAISSCCPEIGSFWRLLTTFPSFYCTTVYNLDTRLFVPWWCCCCCG